MPTQVRKLLQLFFTPRMLESLRTRVETLMDRLLDEAWDPGWFDVMTVLALAVPLNTESQDKAFRQM